MTRARLRLSLLALACISVLSLSVRKFVVTRMALDSALATLTSTAEDVKHVVELRGISPRVQLRERPAQDVIAQVNDVLAEAGLPAHHFKSLATESDTGTAQGERASMTLHRKQLLRLNLEQLTIQELGTFLSRWRLKQQIWTISRLELTHIRASSGTPDRFNAVLLLAAIYLGDAQGPSK